MWLDSFFFFQSILLAFSGNRKRVVVMTERMHTFLLAEIVETMKCLGHEITTDTNSPLQLSIPSALIMRAKT